MAMRYIIFLGVAIGFVNYVHTSRVLGLFAHTGKSHHMVFEPLLKKLAERGHEVTIASFFPLQTPIANYTDVSLQGIADIGVETFDISQVRDAGFLSKIPILEELVKLITTPASLPDVIGICDKVAVWPPLIAALKKDYDVVLLEMFLSDCMLGLVHVHGVEAPIVGLSSTTMIPWANSRIGLLNNPAIVPMGFAPVHRSSLPERMLSTFLYGMMTLVKLYFDYQESAVLQKHYGIHVPLGEVALNTSLILVNAFHPLNGVRETVPAVVEVGGMHLDHSRQQLPKYIERFLNESEHGVVIFSFGSLIKTATIPKYKEEIITSALSKLKQRVIWKYEDSAEEGTLTGNILRVRWLPQYELLRHKKVVAFLAHGGLLGMTEAVSAGKPMVVVPFFGDQPSNGAAAEAAGLAKVVSYSDLTEDSLSAALEKVLSAEMRLQARQLSKIWNDRQNSPLDTAVYWVERVIRWGPAAKLHSPARDMPFYQVALLDVAAAYIALVLTMIALMWFTISRISRLFIREGKQKIH